MRSPEQAGPDGCSSHDGVDTALYSGNRAAYAITKLERIAPVHAVAGGGGEAAAPGS